MAKQKFGLGRGLDALITGAKDVMAPQQPLSIDEHSILEAAIDSIIPNPRQPRRAFREDDPKLLELSASIKEYGLLQPLIVTRLDTPTPGMLPGTTGEPMATGSDSWFAEDDQATENASPTINRPPTAAGAVGAGVEQGREGELASARVPNVVQFQIIAGERRWRAARLAGLTKVPVIIKEATPQEMLELALIENIQRADLNPIEEALAYQTLIQEFGLTQELVAKQVGKDRSTITNSIRLLQLSSRVREALINQPEHFSEGHARALIGISREEDQIAAMDKIISERLNVRQAEELAARIKATERATTIAEHAIPYGRDGAELAQRISNLRPRSPDLDELETQFRNALTVKVDLKCNTKGKGTLVLHFNNQDELERLYHKLCENPPNE